MITCGNNLHEHIISLREDVWTNNIYHILLKWLYQVNNVSGHVYIHYLGVSILHLWFPDWNLELFTVWCFIFFLCVSSNPANGEGYSIQHYVIEFVSDLRQVVGFLRVFRFPPPIKLTTTKKLKYFFKVALNTITIVLIPVFFFIIIVFMLLHILSSYHLRFVHNNRTEVQRGLLYKEPLINNDHMYLVCSLQYI